MGEKIIPLTFLQINNNLHLLLNLVLENRNF